MTISPSAGRRGALVALVMATEAQAQEAGDLAGLLEYVRWGGVAASVLIIAGAMFLTRLVMTAATRLADRYTNRRPLIQKIQTTLRFVVFFLAGAATLGLSFRLDNNALTVIGGSLAFAVGFALRDLVASFIAGITIMFDRPFQVGDRVTYGGEYGDIIQIGLRSVRMNTLDHNIITIPNNKVFSDVTSSGNYGALEMQVPIDFYIGIDQDVALASEIIREACLTSPYVFFAMPIPVLAKQVILQDYLAFHLKVRPYVFDCKYEKPFETDVHLRVLEAFRKHGIAAPAILHRSVPALPSPSSK